MPISRSVAESDDPQLSWAEQQETADGIHQFSVGLWRIFLGSLLITVASTILYSPILAVFVARFWGAAFLLPILDPRLALPTMLCSLVGVWMYLSGKQHCLSFTLPVQKRYLLTGSLACDIGAFLFRLVRDVPGIGPPSRFAASVLVLMGFLMLLGFYAYLAKLIGARISHILSVATGAMLLGAVATAFVAGMAPRLLPPGLVGLPVSIMSLLLILSLVTYLVLTASLSYQLRHFSQFLTQSLEAEMADDHEYHD